MTLKCLSCGGTYKPVQTDGTWYFHACPPLGGSELRAAIAAGASPLTQLQAETLAAIDAGTWAPTFGVPGAQQGDAYLATLGIRRANARDENLDPVKVRALRKQHDGQLPTNLKPEALMVSAGAGVVELDADGNA
ncbi:MAG TPA: hypothetical protein VJN96_09160 [Vicinamibacterales bacterium]|nr:hypothetical protein [Vicinamibacterales bacterium]